MSKSNDEFELEIPKLDTQPMPADDNSPLIAVVVILAFTIMAAVVLAVWVPSSTEVTAVLIALVLPILAVLSSVIQSKRNSTAQRILQKDVQTVHHLINSRMTDLLRVSKEAAEAKATVVANEKAAAVAATTADTIAAMVAQAVEVAMRSTNQRVAAAEALPVPDVNSLDTESDVIPVETRTEASTHRKD